MSWRSKEAGKRTDIEVAEVSVAVASVVICAERP
jgi:hypothetical protein